MRIIAKGLTWARLVAAGLLLGVSDSGAAKEPSAKRLVLNKVDGLSNGKIAYIVDTTTRDGQYLYTSNIFVTQPVLVTLKADNPADDIRLIVTKTSWSKPERTVSTGANGRVQVAFRTQGEFGLAVSSADAGRPYRMTVWVGDEVKRPMTPVVVPRSKWQSGAASHGTILGGIGSLAVWLGVGLLALIAGLLFVLVRKKRES